MHSLIGGIAAKARSTWASSGQQPAGRRLCAGPVLLGIAAGAGAVAASAVNGGVAGGPAALINAAALAALVVLVFDRWWPREAPPPGDLTTRVARLEADRARADLSRRRLERAMLVGGHALLEIDLRDRLLQVSAGFDELVGPIPAEAGPFGAVTATIQPEDRAAFRAVYRLMAEGWARGAARDFRFRHADGGTRWLHCRFDVASRDAAGAPARLMVVASDVSARKSDELELAHQARRDALTGLGNRAAFMAHRARPLGPGAALLLVDLDRFKLVNDRYGHAAGDAWLVEVAHRLRAVVRRTDLVARIGGDEFALVPRDGMSPAAMAELAERVVARLDEPFRPAIAGGGAPLIPGGASVGAARLDTAHGEDPGDALFRAADRALYRAKTLGRRRYACATVGTGGTWRGEVGRRRRGGRAGRAGQRE